MVSVKSVVLKSYFDEGIPGPEQFDIVSSEIAEDIPENSILLEVLVISADPYLRGSIKSSGSSKPGQIMSGFIAVSHTIIICMSNVRVYHMICLWIVD